MLRTGWSAFFYFLRLLDFWTLICSKFLIEREQNGIVIGGVDGAVRENRKHLGNSPGQRARPLHHLQLQIFLDDGTSHAVRREARRKQRYPLGLVLLLP